MSSPLPDSGPDKHRPDAETEAEADPESEKTAPAAPVAAVEEPSSPRIEQEDVRVDPHDDPSSAQTPLENNTKQTADDADTASSLSAAPSPLTAHRPTSSKTSVDELPLTPLDADADKPGPNDGEDIKVDTPKVNGVDVNEKEKEKEPTPTPVDKPSDGPARLPDNQVAAILEINAELIQYSSFLDSYMCAYIPPSSRIYNEFHAQNQTQALASEFQQYVANLFSYCLSLISPQILCPAPSKYAVAHSAK
jgi:hypothetical protein